MLTGWLTVLALSLATTAISATVSKAKIFKPFRNFLFDWSGAKLSAVNTPIGGIKWRVWLWELFTCAYCFSHWVAGVLVVVYRPDVIPSGVFILDVVVSVFVIITIANILQNWVISTKK